MNYHAQLNVCVCLLAYLCICLFFTCLFIYLFVYCRGCVHVTVCIWKAQDSLQNFSSLIFSPCRSQDSNSKHQVCQLQLLADPSMCFDLFSPMASMVDRVFMYYLLITVTTFESSTSLAHLFFGLLACLVF